MMCVSVAPIVSLRLGNSIDPNGIKEGDDVYFDCHVKANPPSTKLTWYHNVSTHIPYLYINLYAHALACVYYDVLAYLPMHNINYTYFIHYTTSDGVSQVLLTVSGSLYGGVTRRTV